MRVKQGSLRMEIESYTTIRLEGSLSHLRLLVSQTSMGGVGCLGVVRGLREGLGCYEGNSDWCRGGLGGVVLVSGGVT